MSSPSAHRIVIIGAGPTGLGAATRCVDLGHDSFVVVDPAPPGGLSRSFVDDAGFTWDLGGHVIFSHYDYFDDVMDFSTNEWQSFPRVSYVFCEGAWVPYPFQNNIHRLPPAARAECLDGLLDVFKETYDAPPKNFREYFTRQFGAGIAKYFMAPYNFKVWAVPPETMSTEWMGERVAVADVRRVCRNVCMQTDEVSWGPNAQFRFPLRGGTGGIWTRLHAKLPQDKFKCGSADFTVVAVDADKKEVHLRDGSVLPFDTLISSMAIDDLLRIVRGSCVGADWATSIADGFVYSSTNIIGLGIRGEKPAHLDKMCWMYFPDGNSPFYRATVFSNYSPNHAPAGHWSLMLEVSESARYKPVDQATLLDECVRGCIASQLLSADDVIVSKWHKRLSKGYPTPFIGRNELLARVSPALEARGILSRGRFGGWKYEVANQDHSMMQGVEAVERALGCVHPSDVEALEKAAAAATPAANAAAVGGAALRWEPTFHRPSVVNPTKNKARRMNIGMRRRGATQPAQEGA
jgi:protoporphyrinogen oxidase